MDFYQILKAFRIRASLTQQELSRMVGVSVVTIRNWESGTKTPSMQAIILLTQALKTSADELLGIKETAITYPITKAERNLLLNYRELDKYSQQIVETVCSMERNRSGSNNSAQFIKPARLIPLYDTPAAAGYSFQDGVDDCEMIPAIGDVPQSADFAVKIHGNSMAPYINDGDTVYVKRTCELDNGDIGIFSVNGAIYCKQYYKDESGDVRLVSANPEMSRSNVSVKSGSNTTLVCYGKVIV